MSFLVPALALALAAAPAGAPPAPEPVALHIERGSVARQQVVAIGRGVRIDGRALADVAALDGPIAVDGEVAGDVIALGGDVMLGPEAVVGGDVFVLGGTLRAAPGSRVEGRTASYPTASAVWLTLLEGPALGVSATSPLVLGAKLALLAAWLALVLIAFATSGRELLSTSASVSSEPFRNFGVGLVAVLAMTLTALLVSGLAGALLALPLLVLVALLALLLKLWGMVAVFHASGRWLGAKVLRRRPLPLEAACVGLAVLGLLKMVPWLGSWTWMAATFIGVGAALTTKFGRREPWFAGGV